MERDVTNSSPAFNAVSWLALLGGIISYLVGLWNADMQLNEKGYYFAVIILGLFSAASYQKTVRDKYEGIPTTSLYYMTCLTAFIIAVALLVVGLWNATLLLSEKGFYGLAFFLSLFGAVAVRRTLRLIRSQNRKRSSEKAPGGVSFAQPCRPVQAKRRQANKHHSAHKPARINAL